MIIICKAFVRPHLDYYESIFNGTNNPTFYWKLESVRIMLAWPSLELLEESKKKNVTKNYPRNPSKFEFATGNFVFFGRLLNQIPSRLYLVLSHFCDRGFKYNSKDSLNLLNKFSFFLHWPLLWNKRCTLFSTDLDIQPKLSYLMELWITTYLLRDSTYFNSNLGTPRVFHTHGG